MLRAGLLLELPHLQNAQRAPVPSDGTIEGILRAHRGFYGGFHSAAQVSFQAGALADPGEDSWIKMGEKGWRSETAVLENTRSYMRPL